jgi:hypothetical protein
MTAITRRTLGLESLYKFGEASYWPVQTLEAWIRLDAKMKVNVACSNATPAASRLYAGRYAVVMPYVGREAVCRLRLRILREKSPTIRPFGPEVARNISALYNRNRTEQEHNEIPSQIHLSCYP